MGRVKDWAMTEQGCTVCGRDFYPMECSHDIDLGAPTCSRHCYNEYCQVMEALADLQDLQPHTESHEAVTPLKNRG